MNRSIHEAPRPTVAVVVPTFREADAIDACLDSIAEQTYPVSEVLVVDGGSDDDTVARAMRHRGVRALANPKRIQSAAMNLGLAAAAADIVVRVDGHCRLEPDYVERCVEALGETGAALVGGAMRPVGDTAVQRGIAAAMTAYLGAGPARFHVGGEPGWVDTVYLGAYRRAVALEVGGYAEDVGVNEDAEFAHRMAGSGGVWFDPAIRSRYTPRASLRALARQFYRYGRSRARTAIRHPGSVSVRQLVAPLLVMGIASPWRRQVGLIYGSAVVGSAAAKSRVLGARSLGIYGVALPVMHLCWGFGFLVGLVLRPPRSIRP